MKISPSKFTRVCKMPFETIGQVYGMKLFNADDNQSHYWYKDNGSNVLAVAHLDSVQPYTHAFITPDFLFSSVLDDRLGVYIMLELLPQLGINCDILLTDGEERGASTGEYFEPSKIYNWMFQFDKQGTEVTMYDYQTPEYKKMLEEYGFHITSGLFTDICFMEHLKCLGINFGCGYRDYHNINAYAKVSELTQMISKFIKFYNDNKETHFSAEVKKSYYSNYNNRYNVFDRRYYGSYDEWDDTPIVESKTLIVCDYCGYSSDRLDDFASKAEKEEFLPSFKESELCNTCFSDLLEEEGEEYDSRAL